jgi:hypothetical protein
VSEISLLWRVGGVRNLCEEMQEPVDKADTTVNSRRRRDRADSVTETMLAGM